MYFLKQAKEVFIYCFAFSAPIKYMNALKNTKQSKTWPFLQIYKTCLDGNICVKKGSMAGETRMYGSPDFHYISIQLLRLNKMSLDSE
jgi:hypothetical protein